MKNHTHFIALLFCVVLGSALTGCSSNSGIDDDDLLSGNCNFEIPDILLPQFEFNPYFQEQAVSFENEFSVFKEMEFITGLGYTLISGVGPLSLGIAYIELARLSMERPVVENGGCTWTLMLPSGASGEVFTLRVFGKPFGNSGDTSWSVKISGAFDSERNYDNFEVLNGTLKADASSGNWSLNDPFSEVGLRIDQTWLIINETNLELTYASNNSDYYPEINYIRTGSENTMEYFETISGNVYVDAELTWNEENHSGSITDSNGKRCYSNYINSNC